MSAPRKGKYSPFSEFLSGAQAEQDELIQHNEQLMEQLRLKEGQLTELSRQMAKLCQVSSEQTSALTTDPASTGEGSETSVQSKRQLKISADGIRDALSHLDRFSIDAAQIVCRRFRYTVENMLTGVCLRPLDIVEMEPDRGQCNMCRGICGDSEFENRRMPYVHPYIEELKHEAGVAGGYLVRYSFPRKTHVSGGGTERQMSKRTATFQRLEDASEYLFCLIRSATFQQLTLERLTLRDEFFAVLMPVAATIFVNKLSLQWCDVSSVDAGILQHALLEFPAVERLDMGHKMAAAQVSDEFLDAVVVRRENAFTALFLEHPLSDETYHVTDSGILRFLFRPTEKDVNLFLSSVTISSTLCAQLFQYALANPAPNKLLLKIDHFIEHEQEGLEAYRYTNDYSDAKYQADAKFGMRLTLRIQPYVAHHTLVFRRDSCTQSAWSSDSDWSGGGVSRRGW